MLFLWAGYEVLDINSAIAPVAQWIERWPPEPGAVVRSHSGVHLLSLASVENFSERLSFFMDNGEKMPEKMPQETSI